MDVWITESDMLEQEVILKITYMKIKTARRQKILEKCTSPELNMDMTGIWGCTKCN